MSQEYALVRKYFGALQADARDAGASLDVVGRALINEVIQSWLENRSWTDVAEELRFTADSLDPDTDFEFMRP